MGHIVQYPASPTTTGSNDPAIRATHQLPRRRNRHRDQIRAALDRFDVHGLHPEDGIATRTKIKSGGCINAPRSVRHVEVLENRSGSLVAPDPPGPRPLPTTHRAETHTPHQNGEEPHYEAPEWGTWPLSVGTAEGLQTIVGDTVDTTPYLLKSGMNTDLDPIAQLELERQTKANEMTIA